MTANILRHSEVRKTEESVFLKAVLQGGFYFNEKDSSLRSMPHHSEGFIPKNLFGLKSISFSKHRAGSHFAQNNERETQSTGTSLYNFTNRKKHDIISQ